MKRQAAAGVDGGELLNLVWLRPVPDKAMRQKVPDGAILWPVLTLALCYDSAFRA